MEHPASIKAGQVVALHGSSALLTVRTISGDYAYCEWEEQGILRQGTFLLSQLDRVPDEIAVAHRLLPRQPRG
ncbi:hypothetical protein [Ramlibacter albus]|uniref:DUF2158 domain-containing protein n=1 Tax=Ramlibacter albus TaxID=2079448 RepID=A0A923MAE6_9BURK|nr:hypothetical protein [Ramlibacter albus]MBC5767010.1 hypothetical protein [Ramlibacter albus]